MMVGEIFGIIGMLMVMCHAITMVTIDFKHNLLPYATTDKIITVSFVSCMVGIILILIGCFL